MLLRFDVFLGARTRAQIVAVSLLLVAHVGLVDYVTGSELSFSIFYLAPVGLAVWYAHPGAGYAISLVSALVWFSIDFISGDSNRQLWILCWNAGVRLGFFLLTAYLLGNIRRLLEQQTHNAQHDGLTGLLNAREFRQRSTLLLDLARRHKRPVALAYLDLDGFKAVNDRLGHATGDAVLQSVAATLLRCVRGSDLVTRLGGDEFAVLLPETDLAGARGALEMLHRRLRDMALSRDWPVGFSIGAAVFARATPTIEQALAFADNQMYRVKQAGRNDVLIAEYSADNGPDR